MPSSRSQQLARRVLIAGAAWFAAGTPWVAHAPLPVGRALGQHALVVMLLPLPVVWASARATLPARLRVIVGCVAASYVLRRLVAWWTVPGARLLEHEDAVGASSVLHLVLWLALLLPLASLAAPLPRREPDASRS